MAKESSREPSGRMNRRQMLGTTTAVLGGVVAGVAGNAFGQEKPAAAAPAATPPTGPNLNPPVVQIKGGRLRGLREGKTSSFLGIRYAEAERFGPPKPVTAVDGCQERPGVGPRAARVRSRPRSAPTSSCSRIATGSRTSIART